MVNALRCRQTDAEWSYRYLDQHTQPVTVGRTMSVDTCIPERELFLAIKLHSGRFTDARDVVAAATDADFDHVETDLHRGDPDALSEQLASISEQLADERGVFRARSARPIASLIRVSSVVIAASLYPVFPVSSSKSAVSSDETTSDNRAFATRAFPSAAAVAASLADASADESSSGTPPSLSGSSVD